MIAANLNHPLFVTQLGLFLLLLLAVPLYLAARSRARSPAAAARWLGITVSLGVFSAAFLGGEIYMRWMHDQPQARGPYASRNWYFRHQGALRLFRGGCARDVLRGAVREEDIPILVLGDSIAWGQGVEPWETFPSLLQERAGAAVLPAARCGWSTADQIRWLERTKIRPRVVILAYTFNDIQDALPEIDEQFRPLVDDWFRAPHRRIPLLGRSYLFDDLVYRVREALRADDYDAWVLASYANGEALARHMEQLRLVAAWCRERDAHLLICVWPHLGPAPRPSSEALEEAFLAGLKEAVHVPVIPLRNALVEAGIRDDRAYRAGPREGHPGPEAHRVAAGEILPYLRRALAGEPVASQPPEGPGDLLGSGIASPNATH